MFSNSSRTHLTRCVLLLLKEKKRQNGAAKAAAAADDDEDDLDSVDAGEDAEYEAFLDELYSP